MNFLPAPLCLDSQFLCGGKWTLLNSKKQSSYKSEKFAKWKDTDLIRSAIKIVVNIGKKVPATSICASKAFNFLSVQPSIHIDFSSQLKFAKIEFYGAFHL